MGEASITAATGCEGGGVSSLTGEFSGDDGIGSELSVLHWGDVEH